MKLDAETAMLNHRYWRRVFRNEFVPQLRELVEALEKRILPGFEGIEFESESVAKEAWEGYMSSPGTGDEDLSEFAEAAEQKGVARYLLLDGIRQGIVNLFAASLYHAFEQQLMLFHRREVLAPGEEDESRFLTLAEFRKRLQSHGIRVAEFTTWPTVEELQLLANTVKHAEGRSSQKLHAQRPDYFKRPGLPELGLWGVRPRVFQPLVGEDLFVAIKDVREYRDALIRFWEELGEKMRETE